MMEQLINNFLILRASDQVLVLFSLAIGIFATLLLYDGITNIIKKILK